MIGYKSHASVIGYQRSSRGPELGTSKSGKEDGPATPMCDERKQVIVQCSAVQRGGERGDPYRGLGPLA